MDNKTLLEAFQLVRSLRELQLIDETGFTSQYIDFERLKGISNHRIDILDDTLSELTYNWAELAKESDLLLSFGKLHGGYAETKVTEMDKLLEQRAELIDKMTYFFDELVRDLYNE